MVIMSESSRLRSTDTRGVFNSVWDHNSLYARLGRCALAQPHGQALQGTQDRHAGTEVEIFRTDRELEGLRVVDDLLDRPLHFLAGEKGTEAVVDAGPQGQ